MELNAKLMAAIISAIDAYLEEERGTFRPAVPTITDPSQANRKQMEQWQSGFAALTPGSIPIFNNQEGVLLTSPYRIKEYLLKGFRLLRVSWELAMTG